MAIWTGVQVPTPVIPHRPDFPSVGTSQVTDDDTLRFSDPVPVFDAFTVWAGPLDPCGTEIAKDVWARLSRGAALNAVAAVSRTAIPTKHPWENFSKTTKAP